MPFRQNGDSFATSKLCASNEVLPMNTFMFLAQATDHARGFFFDLGAVWLILALLAGLFWLWMLIHALTNPALNSSMKIVWALLIFFLPFLGALAYFFMGRNPANT